MTNEQKQILRNRVISIIDTYKRPLRVVVFGTKLCLLTSERTPWPVNIECHSSRYATLLKIEILRYLREHPEINYICSEEQRRLMEENEEVYWK